MTDREGVDRSWSVTLPVQAASVGQARRFLLGVLDGEGGEGDASGAVLLTSELVSNVVRHAQTDVTLTVRLGPPLRVEVSDGVAATDAFRELIAGPPAPAPVSSPSGRGLGLIHLLAARLGLDDERDGGKTVWFEM